MPDELQVPVFKFLREPILRKYGQSFYEALEASGLSGLVPEF